MLRVGLTGGIGAGKSTVARHLVELGATVVDSDQVAREVVLPGSVGLTRVAREFGDGVLDPDGALDRPALAEIVFGDDDARRRLNGILHPLIGQRTAELMAAAPADGILVQDVPLLVEADMAAAFPLVLVVDAPVDVRVERLIRDRGMTEEAARARMAAQADEAARRAAADVWLDNSGSPEVVRAVLDQLWAERLLPFEAALRTGDVAAPGSPVLLQADPGWAGQFDRLAARITRAAGDVALRVDHVGATALPGLPAEDLIEVQLVVAALDDLAGAGAALREVGFVELPGDPGVPARTRVYAGADPLRPVYLYACEEASAQWRNALLLREWLRAEPAARSNFLALAQELPTDREHGADRREYAVQRRRWSDRSLDEANRWAARSGYRTPPGRPTRESTQKV